MTLKKKVFVSYSSLDHENVDQVRSDIENELRNYETDVPLHYRTNGLPDFWVDRHDMRSGYLSKQIADGIDNSYYFLVFISPNSAKSDWVPKEVSYALKRVSKGEMEIIPIILTRSSKGDLNKVFNGILGSLNDESRYIDLSENYAKNIIKLCRILSSKKY